MTIPWGPGGHAERGTQVRVCARGCDFVTICWTKWLPFPATILAQVRNRKRRNSHSCSLLYVMYHFGLDLKCYFILKTPCGVTPSPSHFGAWRFCGLFEGTCLSIPWLNLFDPGRFWEFVADIVIVFLYVDKIHVGRNWSCYC